MDKNKSKVERDVEKKTRESRNNHQALKQTTHLTFIWEKSNVDLF